MMANVRCRCGTEIEVHHQRGDIAYGLASGLLVVHEREAHNEDHGAGSSTGESGCDDTDVAGSSPAQPQPSADDRCFCGHTYERHQLLDQEQPCFMSCCYCPDFRLYGQLVAGEGDDDE